MAREQMEKRSEVFFNLVDVYCKMSGNKFEVLLTTHVIWGNDGSKILYTNNVNEVVEFMTNAIKEYLKEV